MAVLSAFLAFISTNLSHSAPPRPEEHMGMIAADRSIISSDCIGSNESPECVAETAIACQVWSIGSDFTEDGSIFEPELCKTSWLSPHSFSFQGRYEPEAIFQYRLDIWKIDQKTMRKFNARDHLERYETRMGDVAIDVYSQICQPEIACMNSHGSWTGHVSLQTCPRTWCTENYGTYDGYLVPTATLLLRKNDSGWGNFYVYGDINFRDLEDKWRPDHWKVI